MAPVEANTHTHTHTRTHAPQVTVASHERCPGYGENGCHGAVTLERSAIQFILVFFFIVVLSDWPIGLRLRGP